MRYIVEIHGKLCLLEACSSSIRVIRLLLFIELNSKICVEGM